MRLYLYDGETSQSRSQETMSAVFASVADTLTSIAFELNSLAEKNLMEQMDDDAYTAAVQHQLQRVPAPQAPAHLEVLKRIKDWKQASLITEKQAESARAAIVENAHVHDKGDKGTASSSATVPVFPSGDPVLTVAASESTPGKRPAAERPAADLPEHTSKKTERKLW